MLVLSRALAIIRLMIVAGCVAMLTACGGAVSQLKATPLAVATLPTSPPGATQIHTPVRIPTLSGGESYRNEDYAFAFDYPGDVTIEVSEKPFEVRVSAGAANPFSISATRDYLAGDVTYFLDTASGGQRVLGEYTWQAYELPEGYCDGSGCSSPIYALQMEAGQVLYKVVFHDQATTLPLQEQILSTFRILP